MEAAFMREFYDKLELHNLFGEFGGVLIPFGF